MIEDPLLTILEALSLHGQGKLSSEELAAALMFADHPEIMKAQP